MTCICCWNLRSRAWCNNTGTVGAENVHPRAGCRQPKPARTAADQANWVNHSDVATEFSFSVIKGCRPCAALRAADLLVASKVYPPRPGPRSGIQENIAGRPITARSPIPRLTSTRRHHEARFSGVEATESNLGLNCLPNVPGDRVQGGGSGWVIQVVHAYNHERGNCNRRQSGHSERSEESVCAGVDRYSRQKCGPFASLRMKTKMHEHFCNFIKFLSIPHMNEGSPALTSNNL